MTIDYARAYTKERLARADSNHLMRDAIQGAEAGHFSAASLRERMGRGLIDVGARLLRLRIASQPVFRR